MIAAHLEATASVVLECSDSAAADNVVAQMNWSYLRITAIRVDNVFNQPLE